MPPGTLEELEERLSRPTPAVVDLMQALPGTLMLAFAAMFIAVLVGIPLGVTAQRRETSTGFALSLITATVYIAFIIFGDTLNDNPKAMPHLIMWLPNVLFLSIGGWLFCRLSRR